MLGWSVGTRVSETGQLTIDNCVRTQWARCSGCSDLQFKVQDSAVQSSKTQDVNWTKEDRAKARKEAEEYQKGGMRLGRNLERPSNMSDGVEATNYFTRLGVSCPACRCECKAFPAQ